MITPFQTKHYTFKDAHSIYKCPPPQLNIALIIGVYKCREVLKQIIGYNIIGYNITLYYS